MTLTLDQFRNDKSLMLELEKCGAFRALLLVLDDEYQKLGFLGRTINLSEADKIEALGHIQGFNKAMHICRQCLEVPKPALREIQSTYGATEQSAKTKKIK